MPIGVVKWFDSSRHYGFVARLDDVRASGLDTLRAGDRIEFDLETGRAGGLKAVNIRPAQADAA